MGLSIYIVSYVYQKAIIMSQKQVISFSLWQMVKSWIIIEKFAILKSQLTLFQLHEYSGDVLISIVLSTVMYLAFEAPIFLVEHYLSNSFKSNKEII